MRIIIVTATLSLLLCASIASPTGDSPASPTGASPVLMKDGKVVHDDAWMERRKQYVLGTFQYQPRHVHLAYGHNTTEVVVTYSTLTDTPQHMVEYGAGLFKLDMKSFGNSTKFVDGGAAKSTQFIHRVHLSNLAPDTVYYYHVGCSDGWSPVFGFRTVPAGTTGWELKMLVLGDLGSTNARSLTRLQQETHQGLYHSAIHVGDFGYDLSTSNGQVGDMFFDQIEPIAGYLPYMTCPGNHEAHYDFLQYRNRFSMPNYTETQSLYYSFNLGPVHFVSISTEVYFYDDIENRTKAQYEWLVADLEEATRTEVRAERPWIVLFGHRPMYCTNNDYDDCTSVTSRLRTGLKPGNKYAMEPLLWDYSVDLFIGAHEHSYERLYPMYNYTILSGADDHNPYINPRGPVHITTGSAGCTEHFDHFGGIQPDWSAYRLDEYGYTRLNFANHTHMFMEQVSDESNVILDKMLLVRENHTQYPPLE